MYNKLFKNIIKKINNKNQILELYNMINDNKFRKKGCAILAFFVAFNFAFPKNIDKENVESFYDISYNGHLDPEKIVSNEIMKEYNFASRSLILTEPTTNEQKTYQNVESVENKVNFILKKYNLTSEQFNVLMAITLAEARENSYIDAYATINTIYNRTIDKKFVESGNREFGVGCGENLYYQSIKTGQFEVYTNGRYKKFLNATPMDNPGYTAVIDFLYSDRPVLLHSYLYFLADGYAKKGEQFIKLGGNWYRKNFNRDELTTELFVMGNVTNIKERSDMVEAEWKDYNNYINQGYTEEDALKYSRRFIYD